jgi:hypothetical protein
MKFEGHVAAGAVFLPLYYLFGVNAFIMFIASLAIDVDHVAIFIQERSFSWNRLRYLLKHLHDDYRNDPDNAFANVYYIFHTVEFNILLLIASFWYPPLLYVLIGFIYHISTDIIHHSFTGVPIVRWLSYWTMNHRKK